MQRRALIKLQDYEVEEKAMARKMTRRLAMMAMLVGLTLGTAVVSANAQSSRRQVANIPFSFTIGDREMSAGKYEVMQSASGGEVITVRQRQGTKSALRLSSAIVTNNPPEQAKLVFNRYGDTYFLAEVWSLGYTNGRKVTRSSREDALRRELARNNQRPERVEVALARD